MSISPRQLVTNTIDPLLGGWLRVAVITTGLRDLPSWAPQPRRFRNVGAVGSGFAVAEASHLPAPDGRDTTARSQGF
jgi:hypothetical protein